MTTPVPKPEVLTVVAQPVNVYDAGFRRPISVWGPQWRPLSFVYGDVDLGNRLEGPWCWPHPWESFR